MMFQIAVCKYGSLMPSEQEAQNLVLLILRSESKNNKDLNQILQFIQQTKTIPLLHLNTFEGNPNDPNNNVEKFYRENHINGVFYNYGLMLTDGRLYRILFMLPSNNVSSTRINFVETGAMDFFHLQKDNSSHFNVQADIREVLGCIGFHRDGLILAGSPGWDAAGDLSTESTINMNSGRLDATINDCNVFIRSLLALTRDDVMRGKNFIGLVRTCAGVIGLLEYFATNDEFLYQSLVKEHSISGYLTKDDAVILGMKIGGGVVSGNILGGFYRFDRNSRLIGHPINIDFDKGGVDKPNYSLLFYSGHGSTNGDIQIEVDKYITAEELVDISIRQHTPFFIILDMCYAARFGKRFVKALKQHNWMGIAICANDELTQNGLSFESTKMYGVRYPTLPIEIDQSDPKAGLGIFSSAFCLGLLQIRENELVFGLENHVSIEDFVNCNVKPLCEMFSVSYDLPLIKPTIFAVDETGIITDGTHQEDKIVLTTSRNTVFLELPPLDKIHGEDQAHENVLSEYDIINTLFEKNYFDRAWHEKGKGIQHDYRKVPILWSIIVIDSATGLSWQRAGSERIMTYREAIRYVDELNKKKFGGYNDWRLPSIKETMALVEPEKKNGELYIDSIFDKQQIGIWTKDIYSPSHLPQENRYYTDFSDPTLSHRGKFNAESQKMRWITNFKEGGSGGYKEENYCYVRAVRP